MFPGKLPIRGEFDIAELPVRAQLLTQGGEIVADANDMS